VQAKLRLFRFCFNCQNTWKSKKSSQLTFSKSPKPAKNRQSGIWHVNVVVSAAIRTVVVSVVSFVSVCSLLCLLKQIRNQVFHFAMPRLLTQPLKVKNVVTDAVAFTAIQTKQLKRLIDIHLGKVATRQAILGA